MRLLIPVVGFFGYLVWDVVKNGGEGFATLSHLVNGMLSALGLM